MERTCIGGCECVGRLAVLGCHPALCDSSRRAGNFEHNSQNPTPRVRCWVELWGQASGSVQIRAAPSGWLQVARCTA